MTIFFKRMSWMFLFIILSFNGYANESIQTDLKSNISDLTITKAKNWLLYPIVFFSWKISDPDIQGVLIIRTDNNIEFNPENGIDYPLGEKIYKGNKLIILNKKLRLNYKDQAVDTGRLYFYHIFTYRNNFTYSKAEKISVQL